MTPSHATKNGKRYRHYVSCCLIAGSKAANNDGQRIPAGDLDAMVITALRSLLSTPGELHPIIDTSSRPTIEQRDLLAAAASLSARLEMSPAASITAIVHRLVARVSVFTDRLAIEILLAHLINLLQGKDTAGRSRCVSTDAVEVSDAAMAIPVRPTPSLFQHHCTGRGRKCGWSLMAPRRRRMSMLF